MTRNALLPLIAVASVGLSGCDYFSSFEAHCAKRLAPAMVEVVPEDIFVKQDFSLSIDELGAKGAATAGRMVLGLVETKLTGAVQLTAPGIVKPLSGRYCMRPSIKLTLAYKPTTLYVAQQHPPGSCEFDITMDHEQKHVRVYQTHLDQLAREVREELVGKLGDRILYFDSAAAGEVEIKRQAAGILQPYMDRGADEIAKRQAMIDTPEEYFRLETFQSKCSPR